MKGCPIDANDQLYPLVAPLIESEKTIFEQMAHFDARELMVTIPPKWDELTKAHRDGYSMNGLIPIDSDYVSHQVQNGGKTHGLTMFQWTEELINDYTDRARNGDFSDNRLYGTAPGIQLTQLLRSGRFSHITFGAKALVIGSQSPWLEAILLANGIHHVTTSEYGTINATHPQVDWVHPSEFNGAGDEFMSKYDVIASFSSVEHTGLGRYGDPMNPSGDLMVSAQLSCLLKPGGLLFYGLPANIGRDAIAFNAHRYYGAKRLKLMFLQFRIVDMLPNPIKVDFTEGVWQYQPWFVLQNKRGCA